MSLNRQIRNIYTINFLIFLYIIWSTLSSFAFDNKVDYKLYIISLIGIFIMQYIRYRKLKKVMSVFIASIIAFLLMYAFIGSFKYLIMNMIYYLFIVILFSKYEKSSTDYYRLRDYVKKCIVIMIVVAIIIYNINIYQKQEILKFYIIYLASAIILLRKSRAYINNLNKKVSVKNDILISATLIIFCFDWVSDKVLNVVSAILSAVGLVLSYVAIPLEYLVGKFLRLLYYLFGSVLRKIMAMILKGMGTRSKNSSLKGLINSKLDYSKHAVKVHSIPDWVSSALGLLVVLAIVYVVYKFMQRYAEESKTREISEGVFEEREKIKNDNRKKETKGIFNFFKRGKSINDKMIYLFAKFEYAALKSGILKKSMTAYELVEITKDYLKTDDEIRILADAYNEAKFSGKDIHEDKFYSANKIYLKIRKLLRSN